mmetsp:Transcript_41248/g.108948  ORF Transcript_41248/g.108948 Transcript_41248/m.108948 type:complete len:400 (+) Transcript_41248:193-1392(+)
MPRARRHHCSSSCMRERERAISRFRRRARLQLVVRPPVVLIKAVLVPEAAAAAAAPTLRRDLVPFKDRPYGHIAQLLQPSLVRVRARARVCLGPVNPSIGDVELVGDRLHILLQHPPAQVLVLEQLAAAVDVPLKVAPRGDALQRELVGAPECLGVAHHALDVLRRQAVGVCDRDPRRLARRRLLRRHRQDAVGVHVERHVNLRLAAGHRREPGEFKRAEEAVILGERALALEDFVGDGHLVVLRRRVPLRPRRGDHRVPRDDRAHDASGRLDAECEGGHVEEQEVLDLAILLSGEHASLDGGAVRHGLVRVDRRVRVLAVEEALEQRLDFRDARRASDQHDLGHLRLLDRSILEDLLDGDERLAEEGGAELLKLGARHRLRQVDARQERLDLHAHFGL